MSIVRPLPTFAKGRKETPLKHEGFPPSRLSSSKVTDLGEASRARFGVVFLPGFLLVHLKELIPAFRFIFGKFIQK